MASVAKWTFMVYLGGDNSLSGAGETDLQEMAAVGSTDQVNVVAQFDRIGDKARTKRYYVRKGELQEVADLGKTARRDPNVMLDFIAWTKENYPAERNAFVLSNCGIGWTPSELDRIANEVATENYSQREATARSASPLGWTLFRSTVKKIMSLDASDERAVSSGDGSSCFLDAIVLDKVLAEASKLLGQKIDLMGIDTSPMAILEVAYQARDHVNYMVASEENVPFDGWPYTEVLQKLVDEPNMATADFGAHIVDAYIQSYANKPLAVTQAAVDLSKVEELAAVMDELADALITHMPTAQLEIWSAAKKPAAKFWYNQLWDIAHFCERLEAGTADDDVRAAAKRVQEALEPGGVIVAEGHRGEKVKRCGGVAVYLKGPPSGLSRYYGELDFAANHRWHELLQAYHEF